MISIEGVIYAGSRHVMLVSRWIYRTKHMSITTLLGAHLSCSDAKRISGARAPWVCVDPLYKRLCRLRPERSCARAALVQPKPRSKNSLKRSRML